MNSKQIKITITPMGDPTVEAIGFAGVGCADATAAIEGALSGGKVADRSYKPEFSATEEVQQTQGW